MDRTSPRKRASIISVAFICAASFYALAGCETLGHSDASGYADAGMARGRGGDYGDSSLNSDQASGFSDGATTRSEEVVGSERRALESRLELKRLEQVSLESRREKEQYYRIKPLLRTDAERIEFLKVGSVEGRDRWLRSQGVSANETHFAPDVEQLIQTNDVAVGMSKQAVKQSWGEPETIEVAGNPMYGNERWKYVEQVASADGYQTQNRIIYFEGGRVAGWEKF